MKGYSVWNPSLALNTFPLAKVHLPLLIIETNFIGGIKAKHMVREVHQSFRSTTYIFSFINIRFFVNTNNCCSDLYPLLEYIHSIVQFFYF
jgi:hypothetical protein